MDISALSSRGIQAANVPTVVNEATADTALFLLIGALRQFPQALAQLRTGNFNKTFSFQNASDPEGLTLGIVGAGGIGRTLARKAAHALGMHVVYFNRNRLSDELETQGMPPGTRMTYALTLESLLGKSDVVSLHCPLTPETKHFIGRAQLARMQPHAVLVNTARGPVVDEEALVEALENGTIAGAGLDVYENEVCCSITYLPSLKFIQDCLNSPRLKPCFFLMLVLSAFKPRPIWKLCAFAT